MQRRYSLVHLILCGVVGLGLMLLTPDVETQARITFMSDREGNPEIYVMDADGGNPRNLTNHQFKDWEPSWSPNGKQIVFVSDREVDGNHEIYVMDADGSNPRNLTNHPEDDSAPAWFGSAFPVAPAGKKLTIWGQLKQVDR